MFLLNEKPVVIVIMFQFRTPFNRLLVNLSFFELLIALTGNSVVAVNSFYREWTFSDRACQLNAFGMTFLGRKGFTVGGSSSIESF